MPFIIIIIIIINLCGQQCYNFVTNITQLVPSELPSVTLTSAFLLALT